MKFEFQTFSISGTDGVIENCGTKSREPICTSESVDQDMSFTFFLCEDNACGLLTVQKRE